MIAEAMNKPTMSSAACRFRRRMFCFASAKRQVVAEQEAVASTHDCMMPKQKAPAHRVNPELRANQAEDTE